MRRKIRISRGDTLGGTVPLILPGRLSLDPGQRRFGRRRRGGGSWMRLIFLSLVLLAGLAVGWLLLEPWPLLYP